MTGELTHNVAIDTVYQIPTFPNANWTKFNRVVIADDSIYVLSVALHITPLFSPESNSRPPFLLPAI